MLQKNKKNVKPVIAEQGIQIFNDEESINYYNKTKLRFIEDDWPHWLEDQKLFQKERL